MSLSPDQENAANVFSDFIIDSSKNVMVLEGHSGTGKSYLTQHLIALAEMRTDILKTLTNSVGALNLAVTATTNKAARVIGNATNRDASTIHSALKIVVQQNFDKGTTFIKQAENYEVTKDTFMIVDEASMIDSKLLGFIDKSTKNCKLLYVGDPYQLRPIFEKNCPVFNRNYTTAKLTSIQRQAAGNPIIQLADSLRDTVKNSNFFWLPDDGDKIVRIDGPTFKAHIDTVMLDQDNTDQNKILCYTNKAVNGYNRHVRKLFTEDPQPYPGEILISNNPIKKMIGPRTVGHEFVIGNDEEVEVYEAKESELFGLQGWLITTIHGDAVFMPSDWNHANKYLKFLASDARREKHKGVRSKKWAEFFHVKDTLADLRPPFSSTVHKSQGSTYENVYINLNDIGTCNNPNDVARMLYVAITRASNKVYLYGDLPKRYGGNK